MIIANPLYDVVFKYLLDDAEIARGLLSAILGEEVISLELKPQETASETSGNVSILRFDFKAIIKTQTGEHKKVLIELQKAKQVLDVMRFRRYLGDNYRKEDEVSNERNELEKRPLPIVTIYFLGFLLDKIPHAIVKINREYRDVITQEIVEVKEEFVELLTHDSYLIQLRRLSGKARTRLERMLQVFNPAYKTEDPHQLNFAGEVDDPLLKKMVDRLGRAIASDEIRDRMDLEDEIDRIFNREIRKAVAERDQIIEEQGQELEAERQKAESERQKAEAERQRAEDLQRQLDELKKKLGE
ncbi:MAG: cell envelope integrity protein TolA [Bacteroidia bacterium]|nr:cell envelope integrity protein TolA [Bacteroidia bacterium]